MVDMNMDSRFPFLLEAWRKGGLCFLGRVLDLGCSDAPLLRHLGLGYDSYIGLDISLRSLRMAKDKFPRHQFVLGDLRRLPFREMSFDLIFAVSILEHVPPGQLDGTVKRLSQTLTVNGQVAVQIPNSHFPLELHSRIPLFFHLPEAVRRKLKPNQRFYDLRPHTLAHMKHWRLRMFRGYVYPPEVTGVPQFLRLPVPMGFLFIFERKHSLRISDGVNSSAPVLLIKPR
jgi:trans-aconitate methyltransferase